MAAALSITGFSDSFDYKIVKCTGITDTTSQVNVTGSSGTLYAAYLDSTNCTANVSLHILNAKVTSDTQFVVRGIGSGISTLQIPTGFAFDQLNFWISANSVEDDTTAFSGTVAVTLVCT